MGKNWAIVVGINHYENLKSLNFAKRDASVMATWFQQEARFDQVFLFTDDSAPIPANPPIHTQPTFGHLRRFLRAQFENIEHPLLKPEDNLWFFFAGHGNRYNDKDYLIFSDSDPGDIEHTAISVDFVTQKLRRSGADNVVLFLDACRDKGSRAGFGIGQQKHQGVITFYSCTAYEKSWEIEELKHGSFTYSLLEGLRLQGEANCATVERLAQYLRHTVPHLNTLYGKPPQNPYLQAEPPYKMYFILLEQTATLRDVEPLKIQAFQAENRRDLLLAKQLWVRVSAVSPRDLDVIDAFERIALRQRITRQNFLKWLGLGSASLVTAVVGRKFFNGQSSTPIPISVAKPKYILSATEKAFGLPLWNVEFETVTVDEEGQVIKRDSNNQAKFFKENLGNGVTLEMVSIPGGSFKMGSLSGEKNRSSSESPQHDVNVPAFFMGRFEVTQEQYQKVMGKNPSNFKEAKHPVEQVSWNDAVEFCKKLSQKTGRPYRLPSEAEWEYACRAGTTTPFHFGKTMTTELANYKGDYTYASEPKGKYRKQTTEVGIFPPNAFGLYDMHGNVSEWCEDTYHDSYNKAPSNGSAWIDNNNQHRLLRGGSWYDTPEYCRCAVQDSNDPINNLDVIGFRVVCAGAREDFLALGTLALCPF
jgi:formylglycine-generating enzyme required for sulfatase activity/uncharacterized caspase-like protein